MIAAIGLVIGIVLGVVLQPSIPLWLQPYLPIAVVAALDAVFGAARALLDDVFDDRVFVVSFLSNIVSPRCWCSSATSSASAPRSPPASSSCWPCASSPTPPPSDVTCSRHERPGHGRARSRRASTPPTRGRSGPPAPCTGTTSNAAARPSSVCCSLLLGFAASSVAHGTASTGLLVTAREDEVVRVLDDLTERQARLETEQRALEAARDRVLSGSEEQRLPWRAPVRTRWRSSPAPCPRRGRASASRSPTAGRRGRPPPSLLDAVQELRDAGAEAIQIGDVRVVASTWFDDAPNGIGLLGVRDDAVPALPAARRRRRQRRWRRPCRSRVAWPTPCAPLGAGSRSTEQTSVLVSALQPAVDPSVRSPGPEPVAARDPPQEGTRMAGQTAREPPLHPRARVGRHHGRGPGALRHHRPRPGRARRHRLRDPARRRRRRVARGSPAARSSRPRASRTSTRRSPARSSPATTRSRPAPRRSTPTRTATAGSPRSTVADAAALEALLDAAGYRAFLEG